MELFRSTSLALLLALASSSVSACRAKGEGSDASAKPSPSASEVRIDGLDTSALTPRERREWAAQLNELLSPCADTPVSIAQCSMEKRACKSCIPAADFLLRLVRAGLPKKEREESFHARFDAQKVRTVVVDGSPSLGSPDAPITIVEWADFQCPHCRMMVPLLDQLAKRYPSQVRLVFKFYPLRMHAQGMIAAKAAAAAAEQGKFWEMHHGLFENAEHLEPADLEKYAKQQGLDLQRFKAAMGSPAVEERIAADQKQADELGLSGTPFIYINGREVGLEGLQQPLEDLDRWVRLDMELAGQVPRPVDVGAPSSPSAAAASPASATRPASASPPAP